MAKKLVRGLVKLTDEIGADTPDGPQLAVLARRNRRPAHVDRGSHWCRRKVAIGLYRPRLVGHRAGACAAGAAGESRSRLTAAGGLGPCRPTGRVASQAARKAGSARRGSPTVAKLRAHEGPSSGRGRGARRSRSLRGPGRRPAGSRRPRSAAPSGGRGPWAGCRGRGGPRAASSAKPPRCRRTPWRSGPRGPEAARLEGGADADAPGRAVVVAARPAPRLAPTVPGTVVPPRPRGPRGAPAREGAGGPCPRTGRGGPRAADRRGGRHRPREPGVRHRPGRPRPPRPPGGPRRRWTVGRATPRTRQAGAGPCGPPTGGEVARPVASTSPGPKGGRPPGRRPSRPAARARAPPRRARPPAGPPAGPWRRPARSRAPPRRRPGGRHAGPRARPPRPRARARPSPGPRRAGAAARPPARAAGTPARPGRLRPRPRPSSPSSRSTSAADEARSRGVPFDRGPGDAAARAPLRSPGSSATSAAAGAAAGPPWRRSRKGWTRARRSASRSWRWRPTCASPTPSATGG